MAVDFDSLSLTVSYIAGNVLREELAACGAQLDIRVGKRDGSQSGEQLHVRGERTKEAKRVMADVVDERFITRLSQELRRIHAVGVLDVEIKYGNIAVNRQTGQPYWIDFDHATLYPRLNRPIFEILRRQDLSKFNLFFGADRRAP